VKIKIHVLYILQFSADGVVAGQLQEEFLAPREYLLSAHALGRPHIACRGLDCDRPACRV